MGLMKTELALELIKLEGQALLPEIKEGDTIVDPGFIVDDDNIEVATALAAWLARQPHESIDVNKGLLIIGNVGTGKTLLLKAVRGAMYHAYRMQFGIRSCGQLVRDYTENGYEGIETWMSASHVCFDDLGTESEGVHYGKRTNVMSEIIEARYERLNSGQKCWTHLTTNLGTDGLRDKYGARAFSRLRHMCNLLDLGASEKATDRRGAARGVIPVMHSHTSENIYSAVHPRIAARLIESLTPVLESMRASTAEPKMSVVHATPSQTQDVVAFTKAIAGRPVDELKAAREKILLNNTIQSSEPILAAIDNEILKRSA